MTTSNKFIYFSGIQVEGTRGENYKVILEEDEDFIIYVSSKDVERIQKKINEQEQLIAIILAYVEYIYRVTQVPGQRIQRLEQQIIDDNIIVILSQMCAEEVIDSIKTFKWHEILDIFDSDNPIQKIRDLR